MEVSEPTKTYKYQEYLDKYPDCPPESYTELSMSAFRWVFEEGHEKEGGSFLPVSLINPRRINSFDEDSKKCESYGLSMFDSLRNARSRFFLLRKRVKELEKRVGKWVAELKIEKEDGVGSQPTNNKSRGHFTFHVYKSVNLSEKIVDKQKL